jgi:glycosyltransferase involved in cell wall biosynthesis
LFSYLAKHSNYSIRVFYTLGGKSNSIVDSGFGVNENWNIDLLSGYDYEFIENTSSRPSSQSYWGIKNPSLINKIKAYNPHAIILFGWKHQSHLSVINYFHKKIPVILRGDSTTLDDSSGISLRTYFRFIFLQLIYRNVNYVLSPGSASDKYFFKSGLRQNQIIRAEHAIDNDRFMNLTKIEEKQLFHLSSSLSIKPNEIVFLFAGKFIHKKNPLLLIDAFTQLKQQNDNVRLLLVGNGILENKIKESVIQLPIAIAKSITLLPFQDQLQMKLLYRVADVFVLPSKSETWGLSINEALASGTAVIVSDKCGSANDLVKNEVNGLIFKSENSQDLLQQMQKMCNDEFREILASNAKDSLNHFTYDSFINALDKIFPKSEN